jgi:hypothetical protein
MTEFKKGDKVTVREGATSIGGQARDPKEVRTVRTVWDDGRVGLYPVQPAAPGNVFESEDLVPHVEPAPVVDDLWDANDRVQREVAAEVFTAPAPLDPAKVAVTLKGGDYIEAESDGAKVGGKVSHVTERGLVAIEHLGEFAIHHITASPTPDGYRMFVLTAHQPAPEPEPEWKPGTVLLGNLPGPYPDDQFWVVDDGETDPYVVDDTGVKHYPADLLNVREAVVIDPADADRIRAAAIATGVSTPKLRAVLEHLGVAR